MPDWAIPPHRRWYAARANLWVVAFNTGKVKKEEIPPTYEGFVDPKWKGRIGIELTDQDWMYAVVNYLGEERGMDYVPQARGACGRTCGLAMRCWRS